MPGEAARAAASPLTSASDLVAAVFQWELLNWEGLHGAISSIEPDPQ